MATAALLGITHGLEPDHLAGISLLAGRDVRGAARVGATFGMGHVTLVACWVGAWFLLGPVPRPGALDAAGPSWSGWSSPAPRSSRD